MVMIRFLTSKKEKYPANAVNRRPAGFLALLMNVRTVLPTPDDSKVFSKEEIFCKNCQANTCVKVALPYVLRYLTNELAAMNIKLSFGVEEKKDLE